MKASVTLFSICLCALLFSACGNNDGDGDNMGDENTETYGNTDIGYDSSFAVKAASGGMMEVELGRLAASRAQSQQVREFGQTMVNDHSKANDELKALARQKNIELPSTLKEEHQDKINKLAEKNGEEFDKEYIDMMIKEHKDDIDKFREEANRGNDPDIKAWASEKISTLEHHLNMAQNIEENMENKK